MDELFEKIDDELHIWGKNFDGQVRKKADRVEKEYLFEIEN